MMQFDIAQLEAFNAAVRTGTFDAAARELHVTPSAISQRIKALESSVGRVLLRRSKPVRPTESGNAILLLARELETLTAETERRLGVESAKPHVPLAINADSLATWVMPALARLADVATFEVFREYEENTVSLLREGAVMAAVTSASEPVQGCSSMRLGSMRYRAMATPEFAGRWFPDGVDADSLAVAPIVMFDRNDNLQDAFIRRFVGGQIEPPRTYIPSTFDFGSAVSLGIGWGLIPELQPEVAAHLVDLAPNDVVDVKLYWQQWRLSSEVLETIAAAIREQASASLLSI